MAKKKTTKPKPKPVRKPKLDDTQNALRIFEEAIGGKLKSSDAGRSRRVGKRKV